MDQLGLDFAATHSRRTDPTTSKRAASSMAVASEAQREAIYWSLVRAGGQSLTADEIALREGMTLEQVCRRLPDRRKRRASGAHRRDAADSFGSGGALLAASTNRGGVRGGDAEKALVQGCRFHRRRGLGQRRVGDVDPASGPAQYEVGAQRIDGRRGRPNHPDSGRRDGRDASLELRSCIAAASSLHSCCIHRASRAIRVRQNFVA